MKPDMWSCTLSVTTHGLRERRTIVQKTDIFGFLTRSEHILISGHSADASRCFIFMSTDLHQQQIFAVFCNTKHASYVGKIKFGELYVNKNSSKY